MLYFLLMRVSTNAGPFIMTLLIMSVLLCRLYQQIEASLLCLLQAWGTCCFWACRLTCNVSMTLLVILIITELSITRTRPNPGILIGHFFAVAVYAMYRTVLQSLPYRLDKALLEPFMILFNASKIISALIASELQYFLL